MAYKTPRWRARDRERFRQASPSAHAEKRATRCGKLRRPGLRIGEVDALALDPFPFEIYHRVYAASGQHQLAVDGDYVRSPELVAGEHGVEPGHFLGCQKPLSRLRR